jgi:hypothetical protein
MGRSTSADGFTVGTSVIRFRAVTWDIFRGIQPQRRAYPMYVPRSVTAWRVSRLLFDSFGADRASTEVELAAISESTMSASASTTVAWARPPGSSATAAAGG